MSKLDDILKEELQRLNHLEAEYLEELERLPKGSISMKNIRGKLTAYLQFRSGAKLICQYINPAQLAQIQIQVGRRRELNDQLKSIDFDKKRILRILRKK